MEQGPREQAQPQLSVVVTAHREGILAHRTLRSVQRSVADARGRGVTTEVVCVLDRADARTREFFEHAAASRTYFDQAGAVTVVHVDHGDPGSARNAGVEAAHGAYIALVDSDNLLSRTWLSGAVGALERSGGRCVVHPEYLVTFEGQHVIWPQIPTDDLRFDPRSFYSFNYWDTVCVTTRDLLSEFPLTSSGAAYGPEDWHWNTLTIAAGIEHRVAPGTALFYRVKRGGSRNQQLLPEGRPLKWTPLLTSREVASGAADSPGTEDVRAPALPPALRRVILEYRGLAGPDDSTALHARLAAGTADDSYSDRTASASTVRPDHYRALYADLATLSDDALRHHYETVGRAEGRAPRLAPEQLELLRADRFIASHYRVLHPDLTTLDDGELIRHYLGFGQPNGRVAVLDETQLRILDRLDVAQYRANNPDLASLTDDELVAHYLQHGLAEGRTTAGAGASGGEQRLPADLLAEWTAIHELEPAIPIPSQDRLRRYQWYLPRPASAPVNRTWWNLVRALPDRVDFVFFAPWVRMGGGDAVLARYARLVADARPDETVVVVTTEGESSRTDWLPAKTHVVELRKIEAYRALNHQEQAQLVASLVVQYRPRAVHVINSPVAFDAVDRFGAAMSEASALYLSTFVVERGPDGELFNWMFWREPSFLDHVTAVIVDNSALVDQFHELYRYPREKFLIHHHPVVLPDAEPVRHSRIKDGIDVLWAARLDRQKRPALLADIVAETNRLGLPVRYHVYTAPVIGDGSEFASAVEQMKRHGVMFHEPYQTFADVQPRRFDAFLLNSKWEGLPLTLLDAMSHGIPVVAGAVGGIRQVLDEVTGYPVADPDSVAGYVERLRAILTDPDSAAERAQRATELLRNQYSWQVFEREVAAVPGYL